MDRFIDLLTAAAVSALVTLFFLPAQIALGVGLTVFVLGGFGMVGWYNPTRRGRL